jgi:hypothetical protein
VVLIDVGGEWQVLDGRNRLKACEMAGVAPDHCVYPGVDPIGFVLSANLHRRHLDTSQRSMVALRVEKLMAPEAAEKMLAGKGDDGSGGRGKKHGGKSATGFAKAKADKKSRAKAAKALSVSPRQVLPPCWRETTHGDVPRTSIDAT